MDINHLEIRQAKISLLKKTISNTKDIQIEVLRLDGIHPVISGNKWYKLQRYIEIVKRKGYKGILTFGGAYSNHLHAAANVANLYHIPIVGMIRGIHQKLTPTLEDCKETGMKLHFLSYTDYAQKNELSFLNYLSSLYPEYLIIPEGGAGQEGIEGSGKISQLIPAHTTDVCVAVGTGTTLTGMIKNAERKNLKWHGFVPMKGGIYMQKIISAQIPQLIKKNLRVYDQWNFGGFGKYNQTLIDFMNNFYQQNHIPLDFVYTGKMMFGLFDLIQKSTFTSGSRILFIHSGGLQGNKSIEHLLHF